MPRSMKYHFLADWARFHGNATPVGWRLSSELPEPYQRFHSLPDFKRCAETSSEMTIVLNRHNRMAEEVLGQDEPCWMIFWSPLDPARFSPELDRKKRRWNCGEASMHILRQHRFKFAQFIDLPQDLEQYWIYVAPTKWHDKRFDRLLSQIAEDRASMMWMSKTTGAIFSPYCGGLDLIIPDSVEKARLVNQYADWLPSDYDNSHIKADERVFSILIGTLPDPDEH